MAIQKGNKKNRNKRGNNRKPRSIDEISVCGFKSISEECSIEIRPLTILAGPNSSGKSSMIQPLLLLKQTLEAPYDPGALLLDGPNVRFTSAKQLLSKVQGSLCVESFQIGFRIDQVDLTLSYIQAKRSLTIEKILLKGEDGTNEFRLDMSSEELQQILPPEIVEIYQDMLANEDEYVEWEPFRDRCFIAIRSVIIDKSSRDRVGLGGSRVYPFGEVVPHIERLIHVPSLRGNPERTYPTTAVGRYYPGTFENYVASIISQWQTNRNKKLKELGEILEELGLTWKIRARRVEDTRVELQVGRLPSSQRGGAHDLVSIADIGFGVSQVLPVVVALLVAEKDQIVLLQQPEIHLHPRAQVSLAQILARAADRGVRVIVETHSQLLLTAIQTLVAEDKLAPEKVKLHWFSRRDDGVTEITSADLDKTGAFGEDWPEDFAEVSLQTESAYLDAAMAKDLSP